jgi:DNA-3-methyladenine glycosylase
MSASIAMGDPKPLPRSFYRKATADVARALLGCRLTRRLPDGTTRSVILVETEAYLGVKDRAAHTWGGRRTPRVAPMWGEGGHAYVYFVYGMHFCLNVVTQRAGVPEAVLLRAGIPEEEEGGVASGPAKLCAYLGVTTALSGASLSGPELVLSRGPRARFGVLVGRRVGVDYAGAAAAWPLRFAVAGCPAVTRPKGLSALTS